MRLIRKLTALAATVAVAATVTALPASAACTRLGFSVNDYGKDGPTKDAKDLLDKYIAKTMGERGIKTYKTGPKSVKCDLFLNFIVFDEHTCRAEASVCWDGAPLPKGEVAAKAGSDTTAKPEVAKPAAPKATTAKAAEPKKAPDASSPTSTGSISKPASAAPDAAKAAAEPAKAEAVKAVEPVKPDAPKPAAQ